MEISPASFQGLSSDQIQYCFSKISKPQSLFSSCYKFQFDAIRVRNPFGKVRCSSSLSLDQGLINPRPKLKPFRNNVEEVREPTLDNSKTRKPIEGICCQIEKLVFNRRFREALELFEILENEGTCDLDDTTYDALVNACIGLKSIRDAKRVFNHMMNNGFEPDLYIANSVLLMHVKCRMMIDARRLFDQMPERNLVSWNTMVTGLVESGNYLEAFRLFRDMWEEFSDSGPRTFATMIRAAAGLEVLFAGRQLHSCALKIGAGDDIFISCALIDMYSKCGSIEDAQAVFDLMPHKNIVGWNTLIAGYAFHGYSEKALSLYYEMCESGVKMDHFTFSIIIRICARLGSLEHAKQAHAGLVRRGFGLDIVANTTLVDFYCKWGRIEDARHVFDKMPTKNLLSWNALIAGYGNHGHGDNAVEIFELMIHEGMRPNHITFLAVLSACSKSGLSELGWEIFQSMTRDYKINLRAMHFACMIELLGREGLLDEAFALARSAPFKPTVNMWAALLTACRVNGNLELGEFAAEKLCALEPEKLSNYVVLLNIYNSSGMLKEAAGVLHTLKRKGLRMFPACSQIKIKKQSNDFLSDDKRHAQTKEIYQKVDELMQEISRLGYVADEETLLPDVDENEQRVQEYNSEKLAIAFGLINTADWVPLQIVQDHRISNNCHNAIKLMAMATGRDILVRDASRFHHFKDGECSCGDYCKDQIPKLFPDEVLPELLRLLTRLLQKFQSEWQNDVLKDRGSLPRLKAMTWNMANQDAEVAEPAAVINLKLQSGAQSLSREQEVKFLIGKDTLETMLKSMHCIQNELSDTGDISDKHVNKETSAG